LDLKNILGILRRRKWLAIQACLVVALTATIGTFLLTPTYTVYAKIYMKKAENPAAGGDVPGVTELVSLVPPSSAVTVGQNLASSRPIIEQMVTRLQLRNDVGELRRPDEVLTSGLLYALFPKPLIEVSVIPSTEIFQIAATSTDPQETTMMANTVAELIVEQGRRDTQEQYGSAMAFISEQLESVKVQYETSLEDLKAFKEREQTVNLGTETQVAVQQLADLLKRKEDDIVELAQAKAKQETLRRQLGRQNGEAVGTLALSENPQLRALKERQAELEVKLTEALATFTEAAPQVKSLRSQIDYTKAQVAREVGLHQVSALELEALERQIDGLTAHLKGVDASINTFLTSSVSTLPAKAAQQARLELAVTASQRVYESLLEKRNQLGVAEAAVISNIRVLDPAYPPIEPTSPKKLLNIAVGLFLGILTALGLVMLRDYLDDTVRSPDEIQGDGKLPLLVVIPHFRGDPSIASRAPAHPMSEAYRHLRNNLKFARADQPLRTLLVTSALTGEGKTTTAANLAISFSREGKTVLLVDADLRRPGLDRFFGRDTSAGLSDVLAGHVSVERAIVETGVDGLYLLPAGPTPQDPGQLIESSQMQQLVESQAAAFNVVIVDSPPALAVTDALILARHVDGVLAVFESGRVTRQLAATVEAKLKWPNGPFLGAVLNKVRLGPADRHWYGYHYEGAGRRRAAEGTERG
jgi:capsular exopolysaccharide synthesis family protein